MKTLPTSKVLQSFLLSLGLIGAICLLAVPLTWANTAPEANKPPCRSYSVNPWAVGAQDEDPCPEPTSAKPSDHLSASFNPSTPPPTASTPSTPTASASASTPEPSASGSGAGSAEPSGGQTPSTASEEWSQDAGKTADNLLGAMAGRLGEGFVSPGLATYGVLFMLGLIVFVVVLIIFLARASRGYYHPKVREEILESLPRIITFVPLMLCVPEAVNLLHRFSVELGDAFYNNSIKPWELSKYIKFNSLWDIFNIPIAVIMVSIAFITFVQIWIVEDAVSLIALYVMAVLMPIATAMSIWPNNRRMFWRIIGITIGLALVPPVSRFAWWLMMFMVKDVFNNQGGWMNAILITTMTGVMVSMPVVLGYVMPAVSPYGSNASGGVAGDYREHTRGATHRAGEARIGVQRLVQRFSKQSSSPSPAATSGTAASGAGKASTATGTAAGGKAAASGGAVLTGAAVVVGAVVAAGVVMNQGRKALQTKAREGALQSYQAAGGGYAVDPDTYSDWTKPRSSKDRSSQTGYDQNQNHSQPTQNSHSRKGPS